MRHIVLALLGFSSIAFLTQAPAMSQQTRVPEGYSKDPNGIIARGQVRDVYISTSINGPGPFTAFLILPPESGAKAEWYYVFNNSSVKSLERGAIIGLLMGVLQTNRWADPGSLRERPSINVKYETLGGRKQIIAASLSTNLDH